MRYATGSPRSRTSRQLDVIDRPVNGQIDTLRTHPPAVSRYAPTRWAGCYHVDTEQSPQRAGSGKALHAKRMRRYEAD